MWGDTSKQEHYEQGRSIQAVNREDIEGVCQCGYLTLKASSDFETHNGGLTVERSRVTISREDGSTVKLLRGKNINHYYGCNACVNDWK